MFFCVLDAESESDENDDALEIAFQAVASGDGEKIKDIYELTKTAVFGYVFSILKNYEDSEDVVQDTYVKIYQNIGMYESQGKPMAWIFVIARNLALMKIRNQKRFVDIEEYEWDQLYKGNDYLGVEDKMVLKAAFSKLTSEECQFVMLHALSGIKHREIAEMYGMPLATVLSKYNRAIKKLKKILEAE